MIRFIKNKEIDKVKWDQAVENAKFSTLFAHYDLLQALTVPDTWHALVKNDYEAVMPLPVRAKWCIPYIYTPFFLPQMGIFAPYKVTDEQTAEFLQVIPKKYIQADLILNFANETNQTTMQLQSHQMSLEQTYENMSARYAQNTRRNVRDAIQQNTTICFNEPIISETIGLFRENRGREAAVNFQDEDYHRLQKVAEMLQAQGYLLTAGAHTNDGKLIAGALFVLDHQRIWFWFSGRDNNYAEHKPIFLLLDNVIRLYAEQERTLDFNGSINPNVARMYHSFGGEAYPIPLVSISRIPLLKKIAELRKKSK
ncbi:MAG: GNAT family N-acetyltransferase [Bacteroidales bacterium]|nr:GNAT family N-acetyltransferase [Bacteroidales bacterium]